MKSDLFMVNCPAGAWRPSRVMRTRLSDLRKIDPESDRIFSRDIVLCRGRVRYRDLITDHPLEDDKMAIPEGVTATIMGAKSSVVHLKIAITDAM
jgi:hypothetical protein